MSISTFISAALHGVFDETESSPNSAHGPVDTLCHLTVLRCTFKYKTNFVSDSDSWTRDVNALLLYGNVDVAPAHASNSGLTLQVEYN